MKKTAPRRVLATALTLLTLLVTLTLGILPASANSAQRYFEGTTASGAVVRGERSPITVKHEELTFKLDSFPPEYADTADFADVYNASVTASYTLYNPSDMTVTTQLLFPFGVRPSYMNSEAVDAMERKYDITLDGEAVGYTVRHTYKPRHGEKFDLATDLGRLRDSYTADSFFSPDMTVTAYTFRTADIDESLNAVNIAFDLPQDTSGTVILWPEQSGIHTQRDGDVRLSAWARDLETFTVYAIGKKFDTLPTWTCYKNGGVEDSEVVPGTATLVETAEMTLLELVLDTSVIGVKPAAVSDVDWYNAAVDVLNVSFNGNAFNVSIIGSQLDDTSLMCWYEYDLTLEPGQTAVNSVTAPMYPNIDEGYTPATYTYTYLLSPAATWGAFGSLSVTVETPYYMLDLDPTTQTVFSKTDTGYAATFSSLPDGELTFTLSADPDPEYTYNNGWKTVAAVIAGVVLAALLALAVIVGLIVLIVILIKRKKK